MIGWLMAQPRWVPWALGALVFALLAGGVFLILRAAWHSVDPPYQAVRRRPRGLQPWHVEPVTERVAYVEPHGVRRSLDPEWRAQVLASQPGPPARHRAEHLEEGTRAWDPEELRRRLEDRG